MTFLRAVFAATFLTSVALAAEIAINRADSQELTMRNELPPGLGSQHSLDDPAAIPLDKTTLPLPLRSRDGQIWPPGAFERPNPLWAVPVAALTATRERPIFSPSRRPPVPLVSPAPQAQLPMRPPELGRPLLALLGTVAEGAQGIAIFRDERSKDILRLQVGEVHSGWTLGQVKPREVTMQRGKSIAILSIPSPVAK